MITDKEQALKDELARVRAREKRFRDDVETQITLLQEQLTICQIELNEARTHIADLEEKLDIQESRCQNLEKMNNQLQQEKESFHGQLEAAKRSKPKRIKSTPNWCSPDTGKTNLNRRTPSFRRS